MPVGDNQGRQLNVFVFEVVRIRRDDLGALTHAVVAVHPLATAPTSVRYTDASRSALDKTVGGALLTRGGRNHQRVTVTGVWGVEVRGFGGFQGSGPQRAAKFRREVVRLPEALTAEEVDAEIGADFVVQSTVGASQVNLDAPFLSNALADYDPRRDVLAVNWYDFYNGIAFEAKLESYEHTADAGHGASVGNRSYVIQAIEVGPLVRVAGAESAVSALFGGLQSWFDVNAAIRSYTGTAVAQSVTSVTGVAVGTVTDLATSLQAQVDGVEDVASGRRTDSTFASRWFAQVDALRDEVEALSWTAALQGAATFDAAAPGEVLWRRGDRISILDEADAAAELDGLRQFCEQQRAAAGFLGMTEAEWRAWLAGAGGQRDARTSGTTEHVVAVTDTADGLVSQYGVPWEAILALNGLTPDEALRPGTRVQIPRRKGSAVSPSTLPVYGSHVGAAAWGVDLSVEIGPSSTGDFATVDGVEVLEQGVTMLFEEHGEQLETGLADLPESIWAPIVRARVSALVRQDPRFVAVPRVDVSTSSGGLSVGAVIQAINGGTVRAGG